MIQLVILLIPTWHEHICDWCFVSYTTGGFVQNKSFYSWEACYWPDMANFISLQSHLIRTYYYLLPITLDKNLNLQILKEIYYVNHSWRHAVLFGMPVILCYHWVQIYLPLIINNKINSTIACSIVLSCPKTVIWKWILKRRQNRLLKKCVYH